MKTFRSKIGFGIAAILLFALLLPIYFVLIDQAWVPFFILLGLLVFVFHLLLTTQYILDGDKLIVNAGLIYRRIIDIGSITKIYKTNNPISSPAPSLDRLGILYSNGGSILVSPKDQEGFIAALKEVNPKIELMLD